MTWTADLATYLQANGFSSDVIKSNVYDKKTPNCIILLVAPGQTEKYTLKRDMVLRKPELDVRVRNAEDETAYTKAVEIYNLLVSVRNKTIGNTRFKSIRAISDPFFLEQDENERFVYAVNFEIEIG